MVYFIRLFDFVKYEMLKSENSMWNIINTKCT